MAGRKKVENSEKVGDIQIKKSDNEKKPTVKKIAELAMEHSRTLGKACNVQERKIQIQGTHSTKVKYIRSLDFNDSKGKVFKSKEYCVGVGKIESKQERIIANRGMK
jgi:translation initiation factor 1 (eIF-1/SUI1)